MKLSYITLLTVPTATQQKALNKLLADQQNPHSASYRKWLTPEQYADRFGLSQNDVQKLSTWLRSEGFTIVNVARGRNWIAFSGSAAQVEKTFQTEIHNFNVNGETHYANVTPVVIPAALSGIVTGFRGLHNFLPKSYAHRAKHEYTLAANGAIYLAPGDIAAMYDLNSLYTNGYDGTGEKLAVMGQTDVYLNDLVYFRSGFGLSTFTCTTNSTNVITACNTGNFKYVLVPGNTDPGSPSSVDLPEADIDLQWSGGTARNAQIIYVNAPSSNGGVWDSWYYAVDQTIAPVITLSYGLCELHEAGNSGTGEFTFGSDEAELQKANSEGITFMNSSADQGAANCDYQANLAVNGYAVSYPASSPEVTGVGGTLIPTGEYGSTYWNSTNGTDGGSAKGYVPEQSWNDAEEIGLFCTANSTNSFCTGNDITDWASAQTAIGIWASGSGVSNCTSVDTNGVCQSGFTQPSYQTNLSISGQAAGRFVPDVSLLASIYWPGFLLCTAANEVGGSGTASSCSPGGAQGIINDQTDYGYAWGGTSVASPIFAGIVTILNQYINGANSPGLGNINPTLYSIAATPSAAAFNPVNTPNTGAYSDGAYCTPGTPANQPSAIQCPDSGFIGFNDYNVDSATNYNLVTGLGSVDAGNLMQAFSATVADFTIASTGSSTLTIPAGQATPASYSFSVATTGTGTTFGNAVTFTCSFSPADPTLTNSSCTFTPSSITAGATSPQTVTLSVATAGPNTATSKAKSTRRADNRSSNHPWLPLTLPIAGVLLAGFAGRKASKYSMVGSLCVALFMAGLLVACGGSSTPPVSVSNVAASPTSLYPNDAADSWPSQTAQFTATVSNDSSNSGVTWAVTTANGGTIDASSGLYTAPTVAEGLPSSVTVTATSVKDPSKSATGTITLTPATVPNTYTVTVTGTEGLNTHTQTVQLVVQERRLDTVRPISVEVGHRNYQRRGYPPRLSFDPM
ncbi:MAG: S53 family peptidase, partial [Terriglobales bacterium]